MPVLVPVAQNQAGKLMALSATNIVRGITLNNEGCSNYGHDLRHIVQNILKPEITATNALTALTLICENRCKCGRKDRRLFVSPVHCQPTLTIPCFFLPSLPISNPSGID